ncbi:MAG: DUF4290 domain-containing protein [Lewinellaceae bacterium]|nr:DUF4290 domain-containing protein [Saprospiraceae bacterium]MCB9339790.1 DUF4290 domain-containing protein [Lewinellaceae bacterium]
MEYNSNKEELIIPEYGRNVQNMIRYARNIPNRDERQHFVEQVVTLMMQMHPQNRNLEDYRDKLWKHVFRIAEYDLDVMPPSGEIPTPESRVKKPERVPYPSKDTKFKHYGQNVQKLVERAISMEDGPKKDGFVHVIGSYMKLAYKTWNREHYVSDDIILDDLESLSKGKLKMIDDVSLDNLSRGGIRRNTGDRGSRPQQRTGGGGGRNSNQGKSNNRGGGSRGPSRGRRRKK